MSFSITNKKSSPLLRKPSKIFKSQKLQSYFKIQNKITEDKISFLKDLDSICTAANLHYKDNWDILLNDDNTPIFTIYYPEMEIMDTDMAKFRIKDAFVAFKVVFDNGRVFLGTPHIGRTTYSYPEFKLSFIYPHCMRTDITNNIVFEDVCLGTSVLKDFMASFNVDNNYSQDNLLNFFTILDFNLSLEESSGTYYRISKAQDLEDTVNTVSRRPMLRQDLRTIETETLHRLVPFEAFNITYVSNELSIAYKESFLIEFKGKLYLWLKDYFTGNSDFREWYDVESFTYIYPQNYFYNFVGLLITTKNRQSLVKEDFISVEHTYRTKKIKDLNKENTWFIYFREQKFKRKIYNNKKQPKINDKVETVLNENVLEYYRHKIEIKLSEQWRQQLLS